LVWEINTRCWLRELSDAHGRPITLANVPDAEFDAWQEAGFTHVWLMGVWSTGPKTRAIARAQPGLRKLCVEAFGAYKPEYLLSSPYAIADYVVAESFGTAGDLRQFRERLRQRGIGLILDFVPNHLGLDHAWVAARPDLFVRSAEERPETVRVGGNWIAHGKDPYFPAWVDTAQLDYRLPTTRAAMLAVLQTVANQCDGVRCDMAMLLLEDVFAATWRDFPAAEPVAAGEFWAEAISAVKREHPQFLFIAEAYWDRERRLQELGFDYAYDKTFYDCLVQRDPFALRQHIRAVANKFRPVRFLENHDEPRIASLLDFPAQKAAAVFLVGQPGMRLLYDGQSLGKKQRTPVQFARYWPEPPDPATAAFYDALLSALPQAVIGQATAEFLDSESAACCVIKWKSEEARWCLVVVNLGDQRVQFGVPSLEPGPWRMRTLFADSDSTWNRAGGPLQIDLAPDGFLLLELAR
jgi:hypothetical protein